MADGYEMLVSASKAIYIHKQGSHLGPCGKVEESCKDTRRDGDQMHRDRQEQSKPSNDYVHCVRGKGVNSAEREQGGQPAAFSSSHCYNSEKSAFVLKGSKDRAPAVKKGCRIGILPGNTTFIFFSRAPPQTAASQASEREDETEKNHHYCLS